MAGKSPRHRLETSACMCVCGCVGSKKKPRRVVNNMHFFTWTGLCATPLAQLRTFASNQGALDTSRSLPAYFRDLFLTCSGVLDTLPTETAPEK